MKRSAILMWALAILLALMPLSAIAEDADAVWAYASGGARFQDWLDGELTDSAASATDNYVLCLVRSGAGADYSKYIEAAAAKLEAGISNASTRQRTALALIACGAGDRVPEGIVDESAGALGVMSWIWSLHLLNNGVPSETWTAEAVAEQLIGMQLEDGGWKVTGERGDTDATAMCLQALACCKFDSEALTASIERGVAFLAEHQLEDGGFSSMGNENAESAAQVLIALASLDIAPDDPRFTKNGRTPLDAMLEYRLPSGGFAHLPDGEENAAPTAQALQALIALDAPGEAFYDFADVKAAEPAKTAPRLPAWKRWALIAIGILEAAGCVLAVTRGKNPRGRVKRLLFVCIIAAIASAVVFFIQIDSVESYYDPNAGSDAASVGAVTISIRCDSVAGRADDGSTPEDGVILPPTEISFAEGETVFDALTTAVRRNSIQMEHTGAGDLAYINGINNLYEFGYGELSGWLYSVNGEFHSTGCGAYALSDGDDILWQYTLELGEDLR